MPEIQVKDKLITLEELGAVYDSASSYKVIGPESMVSVSDAIAAKAGKVIANIEPVQDLHGYENPWPAGGGKNLLPMTVFGIKATNTSATWSGNTYTINGLTWTIQTDSNGNVIGITISGTSTGQTSFVICQNISITADTLYVNGIGTGASNNTYFLNFEYSGGANQNITGDTTITGQTVTKASIYVRGGQSVNVTYKPMIRTSGNATFAPYSNICPISGWTGANVTRTGKNLVNSANFESGAISAPSAGWSYPNSKVSSTTRIRTQNLIAIPKGSTFTVSVGSGFDFVIQAFDENGLATGVSSSPFNTWTTSGAALTAISPGNIAIALRYTNEGTISASAAEDSKLLVEFGSSASEYEPTVIPISWQSVAGTVYGGTLDVTTGLLTVTMVSATITSGNIINVSSESGTDSEGGKRINTDFDNAKAVLGTVTGNIISNKLKPVNDNNMYNGSTANSVSINDLGRITLRYGGASTLSEAQSAVTGADIQIVYELATPQTYQLTPTEVEMLLGENNIWADTGDITVGYLRKSSLGTGEAIADAIKSSDASHGQMVKTAMTKTFNDAIEVTTPTFSTLPKTYVAVGITPDHELVQDGFAYLSNPNALGSDWTINTGDNEIHISGTCNDSTYVKASFCVKQKTTATA